MAREKMIESLEKNIENEFKTAIKAKDVDKIGKLIKDTADYQSDQHALPLHMDRVVNHLIAQGGEAITEEVKHKLGEIKDKALGAITPHTEPKQDEGGDKQQIVEGGKDVEKPNQKEIKVEEGETITEKVKHKLGEIKDKALGAITPHTEPKQDEGSDKQKQQIAEALSTHAFDLWNDFMGFKVYGEEGKASGMFHKVVGTSDHYGEKGKEIGIKKLNEVMSFIKYSKGDKMFLGITKDQELLGISGVEKVKDLLLNEIVVNLPNRILPLLKDRSEQEDFFKDLEAVIKNLPITVLSAKDGKGYNIFAQLSESLKSVVEKSPQVASKMLKLIEWDMEKYGGELEIEGVSPTLKLAESYIKDNYYELIRDQVDEFIIKYIKNIENAELQGDVLKTSLIDTKKWLIGKNDITEDSSHPIMQRLDKLKEAVASLPIKALASNGQVAGKSLTEVMLMYDMDLKLVNKPLAANKLDEALETIVKTHPCILEGGKIAQSLESWPVEWDSEREAAKKWIEEHNVGCTHYEQEGLQESSYVHVEHPEI